MNKNIPEIVAPAGSPESFSAALNAGADAVYGGIEGFNMRVNASFPPESLDYMTETAHSRGVKFYLALNTMIFDNDIDDARKILDSAVRVGVDAVIVWDMGILGLLKERGLNIHLSTQASVSNSEAALFYEKFGVKRIVLARELSLDRITGIVKKTAGHNSPLEFECFVHGAMCLAVSGRCLLSWFNNGHSANRGDCFQPCRRTYRVTDTVNEKELEISGNTILSPRDLCTVEIIDKIIDSGVHALKIEGRMRDARYVKTAVECYREARDAVMNDSFNPELASDLKERLGGVFHRGFSNGFYLSPPDSDISLIEGNQATIGKKYIGKVVNYYPKSSAADIIIETGEISMGDIILVTGNTTGALEFEIDSIRIGDNTPVSRAGKGETAGILTPGKIREGDKVFLLTHIANEQLY